MEKEGPRLPRPYADFLVGRIRELRISISHHQYRLLYFFSGKIIVVTHGFLKKSSKVPPEEIERAKRSMNDYMRKKIKERRFFSDRLKEDLKNPKFRKA